MDGGNERGNCIQRESLPVGQKLIWNRSFKRYFKNLSVRNHMKATSCTRKLRRFATTNISTTLRSNIAPTLQRCVALKIVVANRTVQHHLYAMTTTRVVKTSLKNEFASFQTLSRLFGPAQFVECRRFLLEMNS